jgi:hypothetical protein
MALAYNEYDKLARLYKYHDEATVRIAGRERNTSTGALEYIE